MSRSIAIHAVSPITRRDSSLVVTLEGSHDEHRRALYNYFRRCGVPPESAEDLIQNVFVVLLDDLDRFTPERGSLRAYLFGVARNVMRNWFRKHRRERGLSLVEAARPAGTERNAIVKEAVGRIPLDRREALILREFHGLSYREIAEIQKVPVGTVRSRLARAREDLRETLKRGPTST